MFYISDYPRILHAITTRRSSDLSTVPVAAAGSGKSRWTITALPGNTGHRSFALSQTVITKSKSWERYSSTTLDVCPEISTPSSIMTAIAVGFTPCASTPALLTIALSPEKWRRYPSAIWLRQLLPVHRTNMFVILTTTLRRTASSLFFSLLAVNRNTQNPGFRPERGYFVLCQIG